MKNLKTFSAYFLGIVAIALFIFPLKAVAGVSVAFMFNFGTVDFSDEEVRDLAEVILDEALEQPSITTFHTVVQGIIAGKQIVYAGLLEKITKKNEGCGTGATSKEIPFRQKKWAPEKVKVWLELCADELDQTLLIYAKNKGIDVDDLTSGDAKQIANFIVDHMKPAMFLDLMRIVWFNDTDHSNVSDSGGTNEITDTVDLADYNIIDGLFKQLFAIVAADATRRVTITANAGVSYAAQDTLAADAAKVIFGELLTKAHPKLSGASDKIIITTKSLFDNFADYLESQGVDASYKRIESGYNTLQRRGVTIVEWPFWDDTIRSDFDNGTTWVNPHRALLTTPKNLMIGIDEQGAASDVEMWYEKKDEKNNFRSKYKVDAKVAVDYMVQFAY